MHYYVYTVHIPKYFFTIFVCLSVQASLEQLNRFGWYFHWQIVGDIKSNLGNFFLD